MEPPREAPGPSRQEAMAPNRWFSIENRSFDYFFCILMIAGRDRPNHGQSPITSGNHQYTKKHTRCVPAQEAALTHHPHPGPPGRLWPMRLPIGFNIFLNQF